MMQREGEATKAKRMIGRPKRKSGKTPEGGRDDRGAGAGALGAGCKPLSDLGFRSPRRFPAADPPRRRSPVESPPPSRAAPCRGPLSVGPCPLASAPCRPRAARSRRPLSRCRPGRRAARARPVAGPARAARVDPRAPIPAR
jgi:hypothetical protein